MSGFDDDDANENPRKKRLKRREGLLRDPGVRAAVAQSPLILSAEYEAHRFFWTVLIHEAGQNPFLPVGEPMIAPDGWS